MTIYHDQMGNDIELIHTPQRIISLVPSLTELLLDLDLGDNLVRVTSYCELPAKISNAVTRIGGVKNLDNQKIIDLKPDFILGSKEENSAGDIHSLQKILPVWIGDVVNLEDVSDLIQTIGQITDRNSAAGDLIQQITQGFLNLPVFTPLKAAYMIWKNPWMAAGSGTFIHSMLRQCGFENVFSSYERYPVVDFADLAECEIILLSSEPYPFKDRDIEQMKQHHPDTKVVLVDGKKFSWYGSHIKYSPDYFLQLRRKLE